MAALAIRELDLDGFIHVLDLSRATMAMIHSVWDGV
jgi:hypothetical protein